MLARKVYRFSILSCSCSCSSHPLCPVTASRIAGIPTLQRRALCFTKFRGSPLKLKKPFYSLPGRGRGNSMNSNRAHSIHTLVPVSRLKDAKDANGRAAPPLQEGALDLEYGSPLEIVEYPDPRLRAKNKCINKFDEKLQKLVDEMFDLMYNTDGVGLSAPQVGVNVQLMVFNPDGERGKGEEIVLVNPEIYKFSKKTEVFTEGCLSFPEIYADVERPLTVKIVARDITGKKFMLKLKEFHARIFQHEYDHLQGVRSVHYFQ